MSPRKAFKMINILPSDFKYTKDLFINYKNVENVNMNKHELTLMLAMLMTEHYSERDDDPVDMFDSDKPEDLMARLRKKNHSPTLTDKIKNAQDHPGLDD